MQDKESIEEASSCLIRKILSRAKLFADHYEKKSINPHMKSDPGKHRKRKTIMTNRIMNHLPKEN